MKIRSGFVSNSSSSSFLVGFKRTQKTVEEVKEYLFPDGKFPTLDDLYQPKMTADDVAKRVFDDVSNQNPLTPAKVRHVISTGTYEGWTYPSDKLNDKIDELNKQFEEKYKVSHYDSAKYYNHRILAPAFEAFDKAVQEVYEQMRKLEDWSVISHYHSVTANRFRGLKVFYFYYSDDTESFLEHAGIFGNVPNERIGHH